MQSPTTSWAISHNGDEWDSRSKHVSSVCQRTEEVPVDVTHHHSKQLKLSDDCTLNVMRGCPIFFPRLAKRLDKQTIVFSCIEIK